MGIEEIKIFVYDKREKITSSCYVELISENKFRMTENHLFNCNLTKGTEFETRINEDRNHEVVKIVKKSEFITRRFLLSAQYKESDYRVLGDELMKRGGFWQVDFRGIATVNIPRDFEFNIDQVMKELDLNLTEITE